MLFDIFSPPRVLFGPGSSYRLGEEAQKLGKRALVIMGQKSLELSGTIERVTEPLKQAKIDTLFFRVQAEPAVETVDQARKVARAQECDMIIGVGGGSVLDVAKATAGLLKEEADTKEFHKGHTITTSRLPWIALPTTAGSGSEATCNAVLFNSETGRKASIRNESWVADVAIVDPVFTMAMPKKLTAHTGIDALTHAIETYTSRWANPYSDAISQKAAILIMQSIYTSFETGHLREAREKMSLGSYLAGAALNQVRAGAVHALAHSIGVYYKLPHGLVCGVLLPYVMEHNLPRVVDKYANLAYLSGIASRSMDEAQAASRLIKYIHKLKEKLGIPYKLSELGLNKEAIPVLVSTSLLSPSLESNPRIAKHDDLAAILEKNL